MKTKKALCTGCKSCELACSAAHSGEFSSARARLYVENNSLLGESIIRVCHQCDHPACIKACAYDALSRGTVSGVISLDHEKCVHCLACVEACPFQAIFVDPRTNFPLICDNCGGDPICAKFCHHGAVSLR